MGRSMENGWAAGAGGWRWYDEQWKDGEPHGGEMYRRPDGGVFMGRWNRVFSKAM